MKLTSPQPSFYPTLVPRTDQSKIITPADGDDQSDVSPRKKRKSLPPTPSSSSSSPASASTYGLDREQLTPADALLVRLREDEGMAWRDVAARFRARDRPRLLRGGAADAAEAAARARAAVDGARRGGAAARARLLDLAQVRDHRRKGTLPVAIAVPDLTLGLDDRIWCVGGVDGEAVRAEVAADGVSDVAHSGEGSWWHDLMNACHFPFALLNWFGGVMMSLMLFGRSLAYSSVCLPSPR